MRYKVLNISIIALLTLGVIIFGIYIYMPKGNNTSSHIIAKITRNEEVIQTIDLTSLESPYPFTIEGNHTELAILASKDGIVVTHSGCPAQECVRRGVLKSPEELPILCLYNGISITTHYEEVSNETPYAYLSLEGKIISKLYFKDLETEEIHSFETDKGIYKLSLNNEGVKIIEAPCKDQECLKSNRISKKGETISCIESKLVVGIDYE